MADDKNVIDQLQARRSRVRREPPQRRPARGAPAAVAVPEPTPPTVSVETERTEPDASAAVGAEDAASGGAAAGLAGTASTVTEGVVSATPVELQKSGGKGSSRSKPAASQEPTGVDTLPAEPAALQVPTDDPTANYAVRVRRTLDELAFKRIAELRLHGIRVSKVELTEMLLWELNAVPLEALQARLQEFRRHTKNT